MKFKTALLSISMCALLTVVPLSLVGQSAETQPDTATVQAQESTWTGKVELKEIDGASVYVFTVGGQSYMLQPQDKAADFVGKTVQITGTVEGNTVTISQISEAS